MARAVQSLQKVVDTSSPLSETEVLEIVDAIVNGLYEIPLVHRDLKPANILLHNGIWKLADLGLARFVEASTALEHNERMPPPHMLRLRCGVTNMRLGQRTSILSVASYML